MKYYEIGFLWNIMSHGCCDMNQSLQNSQTLGQFFEPLYAYYTLACEVQGDPEPPQERHAQDNIVMVDVGHIEVLFDVFVSKHYGALHPIVNHGLAAHASGLEPNWVFQLDYWDTCSPDIVGGDHHSLTSTV